MALFSPCFNAWGASEATSSAPLRPAPLAPQEGQPGDAVLACAHVHAQYLTLTVDVDAGSTTTLIRLSRVLKIAAA